MPTFHSTKEAERRRVLRETYLGFFRNSSSPQRICSLSELACQESLRTSCQIVYPFFLGTNPEASPEILNAFQDVRSMMVQQPIIEDVESDVVYLHIRKTNSMER
jgi:hypothetical protein